MSTVLALAVLALVSGLLVGGSWVVDQLIARRRGSPWVVYLLLDERGAPLYVGQTNAVERRYGEHRRRPDPPWAASGRTLAGYAVARHARDEAQARRCEARMVRALTLAARWRLGPEIHNEVLYRRRQPVSGPVMVCAYLAVSATCHGARWHRPNPRLAWFRDPEPVVERQHNVSDQVLDVSYRPSANQHAQPSTPEGGGRLLDLIADTPRADPQPETDRRPPLNPGPRGRKPRRSKLSDEERAARRRESNRKAQAKRRANRPGGTG